MDCLRLVIGTCAEDSDESLEAGVVARISDAADAVGLWQTLRSDWMLLDTELMPWSAKAQELLNVQYRPTVAAARVSAEVLLSARDEADGIEGVQALRAQAETRHAKAIRMGQTIDGYCWSAETLDDYRIAPFHLLAAEGQVFTDRSHVWHMDTLAALCAEDPILRATGWCQVDTADANACAEVTSWWEEHTSKGGEGMVVKTNTFIARGDRGLIQPAMKVRGRDYLRIIYGPDYDLPENIERLRKRGLGRKFSLADREFRLGLEGLHRFVERKPLRLVHECALAVLDLESEPVDPRL